MSSTDSDMQQDKDTLEHLLGVVVENREQRCKQVREKAHQQATQVIKLSYSRGRARMHHHIDALREKYRLRVASAIARNQTQLRKQHQKEDRAMLDIAWPLLHKTMLALWKDPDSRRMWLDAAIESASSKLRQHGWHIEHPLDLSEEDINRLSHTFTHGKGKRSRMSVCEDIEAGIRISRDGTVIDATVDGLLHQKTSIEATLIARIKQGVAGNE